MQSLIARITCRFVIKIAKKNKYYVKYYANFAHVKNRNGNCALIVLFLRKTDIIFKKQSGVTMLVLVLSLPVIFVIAAVFSALGFGRAVYAFADSRYR